MTTDDLRDAIKAAGGLLTQADIARRYSVSKERAAEIVSSAGYPAPLEGKIGRSLVWIGNEVDAWRSATRAVGRPKGDMTA